MTDVSEGITWVTATAKAVDLARNAEEAQKQADILADSKTELGRVVSQLRDLHASAEVLRSVNWEGRSPNSELLKDLAEASRTLDSRPLNRVQRELDQFARDVTSSLKEHWSRYAADQLGDVTDLVRLSETLSGVEGISDISQELNSTLGALARSQTSLPSRESAELLKKAESLLTRLETSLKPDGVRRFLSAVARGGASVESLTSDVVSWLANHDASGRFRIVPGPPVGESND